MSSPKSSPITSSPKKVSPDIVKKGIGISLTLYALAIPLSMSASNIALGLTILFTLVYVFQSQSKIYLPRSIYPLLLFFLWASVTVCVAENRFSLLSLKSFDKTWNLAGMIFIPAGFAWKSQDLKKIFKILLFAASAVAVAGFMDYAFGKEFLRLVYEGRFYGFQSHPLHTGGLYCLLSLTAVSLALFSPGERSEKFVWAGTGIILFMAVILTRSRSYYLAWALGFMFLLGFKGVKTFLIGICAGACLVLFLYALDPGFQNRINSLNVRHTDESAKIRFRLWKAAELMVEDHPLTGVGYHNWRNRILEYSRSVSEVPLDQASFAHAHNSYLTFAAETGLPGLFLFLCFWFFLIKEQLKVLRTSLRDHAGTALILASIAGLLALLLAAVFEHNLLTASLSLYLFFLIGLSRVPSADDGEKS